MMNTRIFLGRVQFHGAKRLIEPRHRFYWGIALLFLMWCALSNLSMTVIRFLQSPTYLVSVDTVSTSLPFPAVLVCPEIYYASYKIENFLEHAKYPEGMSADSIRPIIKQLTAFFSPDPPYNVDELSRILEFLDFNDLNIAQAGESLTTSCKETFYRCRFHWQHINCSDVFRMELTVYGFCCVFNGKSLKREFRHPDLRTKPGLVTTEVGPFASLMMAINQSQYLNNVDLTYKWLVVQNSHRYVDIAKNGTALSPGTETWSSFHTRFLRVSDDSRFLGDSLRGCGIENKQLKYFPVYNKKYCLLECRMELTIRRCQCLMPFHFMALEVPLCDARSLACARRALEEFDHGKCDCPFNCEYQTSYVDTSTYKFSSMARPYDSFYDGLNLSRTTVARVFVRSHQTTSHVRRPIFNFYDLFSQLGGVFNVFFGCSILSALELFQLAWYSFQGTFRAKTLRRLNPKKMRTERKKMKWFFFGVCCRVKGRVRKRVSRRTVCFLNTRQPQKVLKLKIISDLKSLK